MSTVTEGVHFRPSRERAARALSSAAERAEAESRAMDACRAASLAAASIAPWAMVTRPMAIIITSNLFCVGGSESGQSCNWKVQDANTWRKTNGGKTDNIAVGTRPSGSAQNGDSGGPVYTFRSDGSVVAKGLIAAGVSPFFGDCELVFTDITTIREAFGGDVLKRK